MQEKWFQDHEDDCLFAGNLVEETNGLIAETDNEGITYNTGVLTIICC